MAYGTTSHYGDSQDAGSAGALTRAFAPGFVEGVYRLDDFLSLQVNGRPVFPISMLGSDSSSYRWKVNISGNTSVEIFSEGGALPTPVAQDYRNAAVAATYFRGSIRLSGHLRDAVRAGAYPAGLNPFDEEFALGARDLQKLVKDSFIGSSNSGLEVAIDSATAYAGVTRGSASWFESQETAQGGALTVAGMRNLMEAMRDNDVGATPGLIVWGHNQASNYITLAGEPAAANSAVRVEMTVAGGGSLDLIPRHDALSVQGVPAIAVGGITDTVISFLDITPDNWHLKIRRPFELRPMPHSGDDDVWQISTASALVCKHPKMQGKLTGVTA